MRGAIESALRVAYRGDWPARAWAKVPGACEVERTELDVPLLGGPGARGGALRVGFVSDVHLGPTTPPALLRRAFEELAGARLDVLLLGGDYVFLDADDRRVRALTDLVASVPAARKLAVLGNHDLWTEHAAIERALERAGAELVIDRSVAIGELHVVGLDDPWTGTPDADRAFAGALAAGARALVVLCHSPDGLPLVTARARVPTLYVCGHTHGGHVATPWGPIVTATGPVGHRYARGRHRVGTIDVYVSRGVGGIEVPFRAWARPEVVVATVR